MKNSELDQERIIRYCRKTPHNKEAKLFVEADEISKLVGNNIKRLRKLSQVKKAGYYKEQNFLQSLKQVNETEKWGIKYSEDGKLIVTEDDNETVLTVLNNSRLKSLINSESFDVDVKHKFEIQKTNKKRANEQRNPHIQKPRRQHQNRCSLTGRNRLAYPITNGAIVW